LPYPLLYNLLETLITAKYRKNHQRLLDEANLNLEILRLIRFQLAKLALSLI